MKLVVDDNGLILEYCTLGNLSNSIEFDGEIPDDFEAKFKPSFYTLKNNIIVENPNYKEQTVKIPDMGPMKQDRINAQLMLDQASQKKSQDKFNSQLLLELAKLGGDK